MTTLKTIDDTIQLCEVGDVFYKLGKDLTIKKITIAKVIKYAHYVYRDTEGTSYFNRSIKKLCFKTEEEAEEEQWRRERIQEKKQRLKEYEELLNEKLRLEGHFIVK